MTFECKRCGKRMERKGFKSTATFYTLCDKCVEEVLYEWKIGLTKVDLQGVKQKNVYKRRNK